MKLRSISIEGYKTIREARFEPGNLAVLIGPNGAGKSNLIAFFRLLSYLLNGDLRTHVGESGGASKLLHDGPRKTQRISAHVELETARGINEYAFQLGYAAGDTLIFLEEKFRFSPADSPSRARWTSLDAGHKESNLAEADNITARAIRGMLRKIIIHQFHNTSRTSRMRERWRVVENRRLKEDGGNLAPFLHRLKSQRLPYYLRVVETVRTVLPFFADFELEPDAGSLLLQWREQGTDVLFDASQASDGMLRLMAMIALLRQPEEDLPGVILLDEPELGLHPSAIQIVVDLLSSVSQSTQVLVATQSVSLVDRMRPEDVVVVDRINRESRFTRLDENSLRAWLDEYTLSELWEKNVIGGRPA
ncbi:MAG: AAA family ATPase [Bryobacterales bacterium]|nr:AAA family ATPase [Bryobacterales bacterium]